MIRDPAEMRSVADAARQAGRRICVVPTMGYLHEGHLSLLREGRRQGDLLILTLFVNPTQFGPKEDLAVYPRDEPGDLDKAASCGSDIAFCPTPEAMYGPDYQTYIEVRRLKEPLCGASRPGHFAGVASVVCKLFNLTRPHVAIFGQKDFQQLALLRRMNTDLDFGIEIIGMPIVRESDGIALSSRNQYLSADERAQATSLSRGIAQAHELFAAGERSAAALVACARRVIDQAPLARIDYVELRDAQSLRPIDAIEVPAVMAMAVYFGKTRLIDNKVFTPPDAPEHR